jgi:Protein of unknown function (DUF3307)
LLTADDLLCHAIGDFILQSDWVALNKSRRSDVALLHAALYSVPFLALTRSRAALAIIAGSHFAIDRWRLTRYLIWAKNWLSPPGYVPLECCDPATGFPRDRPAWMTFWLYVVIDNTLHLVINAWALTQFGRLASRSPRARATSSRARAW